MGRGRKIIKEEDIEILLGYSDAGPAFLGAYALHKITRKPLFLFFYDLYRDNAFSLLSRMLAAFLEPLLFREAEQIFVMNEALQAHYRKKYGRESIVIHNSIPIPDSTQQSIERSEPYRVLFTGSIDWPQLQAMRNLMKALETINVPRTELHLYTPHDKQFLNRRGIFENAKIIFLHALPREMRALQREADILFVPLSFNTKHPLLINTSSPGKTYEYMISGRPILMHAPRGSYIAEYAKERQFALVVDEDNPEKLKEAALRLLTDKELVERLVRNAWQTASEYHNAKKESEKFQQYFLK